MPTFFLNLLNNYENKAIIYKYHKFALVAQLDRVFGYEPKGRGFESLLAYQKKTNICKMFVFFLCHEGIRKGCPQLLPKTHEKTHENHFRHSAQPIFFCVLSQWHNLLSVPCPMILSLLHNFIFVFCAYYAPIFLPNFVRHANSLFARHLL